MSLITVALGVMKAVNGHLMQDAGKQEAQLPSGETKMVDSHETPDDPQAIPIKP